MRMEHNILARARAWALGAVFAGGTLAMAVPAEAKPPAHAPAHGYRRKAAVSRYYRNTRFGTSYYRTRRSLDIDYDGVPDYRDRWITRPQFVVRRKSWAKRKDIDRDGVRNRRDPDKDGDGKRDRRDRHPNNPRRR